MRTYLILRDKVRRFHEDPDIREALETAKVAELRQPTVEGTVNADTIAALRRDAFAVDLEALSQQGYGHERLDQLVTELLLGVR
jgi:xylose isomerase